MVFFVYSCATKLNRESARVCPVSRKLRELESEYHCQASSGISWVASHQ